MAKQKTRENNRVELTSADEKALGFGARGLLDVQ